MQSEKIASPLSAHLLLQLYANYFESLHMFWSLCEDVQVVR